MSWLQPSAFEQRLLEDVSRRWPRVLPLARVLALATRIEPLLLRNARLRFLGNADTELESLLWFSPLVGARSSREIILRAGSARLLVDQLKAEDPTRFADAWACTRAHTRHWSAEDRLEQDLRYHALENDQGSIRQGLRDMLKRIQRETDEERRIQLARWVRQSLPQLVGQAGVSEEARLLAQYASHALGATAAWSDLSAPETLPEWLAAKLPEPFKPARLAVELRHDPQHLVLHCLPSEGQANIIDFPSPLPAKLYIQAEGMNGAWHVVVAGSRVVLPAHGRRIRLTTIAGRQYKLEAEWPSDAPATSESSSPTLFLAHVAEDAELAHHVATWLQEQGLIVELLDEDTAARLGNLNRAGERARLLRLWTPAARRHWLEQTRDEEAPAPRALLLRTKGAEPPDSGSGAEQLLELPDWRNPKTASAATRFLDQMRAWLAQDLSTETVATPGDTAEVEKLLAELHDPRTTPPRRLEIGDRLVELGDPRPGVGVREIEVVDEAGYVEPGYWAHGYAEPVNAEPETAPGYSAEVTRLLAEIDDPRTEPPRRLEIGDLLAELGDSRPGVGLDERDLPDIDWVEIPGGSFIYQEGETRELPTFWIARYPITNAQYQAFIDDGGYRTPRWWQGLTRPKREKPTWPQPNRPRTDIDWREAVAFSRWLGARLGLKESELRLPTEEEWEKAARGTNGLAYPWGWEYRSGYANVDEKETKAGPWHLEQTMAVGVYPHGHSPYGVADLAGTVWEWCWNKDEQLGGLGVDGGDVRRILRGGSWIDDPVNARAVGRYGGPPVNRGSLVGFRLVSLVPMASADR